MWFNSAFKGLIPLILEKQNNWKLCWLVHKGVRYAKPLSSIFTDNSGRARRTAGYNCCSTTLIKSPTWYFITISSAVFELWLKQWRYNGLCDFNRRPAVMQMQDRNRIKSTKFLRIAQTLGFTNLCSYYSNIYPTKCNVTQFILSGNCSTCFGWYHHPSPGAQTTASTVSDICQTVTANCRYRGR
jgi:hypothetical protein